MSRGVYQLFLGDTAGALLLPVYAAVAGTAQAAGAATAHTIIVRMIDQGPYGMAFDPTRVTVHRGDTVRFVQAGNVPHNVELKSLPERTDLGVLRVGPALQTQGETYSIVIDQRFVSGQARLRVHPARGVGSGGDH